MKTKIFKITVLVLICAVIPCLAFAQDDPSKMAADQAACQEHAKASTGYDPANPDAYAQQSGPPPQRGAGLRGAARGAAKGAIVGGTVEAIGDDSRYDDAAEIGAGVGAVSSGLRSRRQAKDQAEEQQAKAAASGASAYTKSYNECMKMRGYTVD